MTDLSPLSEDKSSRACAACQKYKRRCDKALPSCSLCVRLQKVCDYKHQVENDFKTRIQELEAAVGFHLGTSMPQSVSESSNLERRSALEPPSTFYPAGLRYQKLFLDTDIRTRPPAAPPPSGDMVHLSMLTYLKDQSQRDVVISQYFQTVHKWMPIISRVRLLALADMEWSDRPRADFVLLLLSMRLIQETPADSTSGMRNGLYVKSKELAATLDIAGVFTLLKLQANLILLLFEMGHGIFPAAYTSMGSCITQAMALGIHNPNAPQILDPPRTWIEWEERQRVWWLIVIVDRYISSVGDNRALLSADPKTSSHLPVDDAAWDSGRSIPPERLLLSSSKQLEACPFARLAQASHLQGEVIKHCNDGTKNMVNVQNDVEALSQTISAFLAVISKERSHTVHFYSAVGVCLSALMKLSDHHSCESFATYNEGVFNVSDSAIAREIAFQSQSIMKKCITQAASFMAILNEMMQTHESLDNFTTLAPWFLDSIYQTMSNLAYLISTTPVGMSSEYLAQKNMCVDILRKANRRWKVAGAYLEAIELVDEELKIYQY